MIGAARQVKRASTQNPARNGGGPEAATGSTPLIAKPCICRQRLRSGERRSAAAPADPWLIDRGRPLRPPKCGHARKGSARTHNRCLSRNERKAARQGDGPNSTHSFRGQRRMRELTGVRISRAVPNRAVGAGKTRKIVEADRRWAEPFCFARPPLAPRARGDTE
jgi:hypothetical protein